MRPSKRRDPPHPKLDDQYWFDFSEKLVTGAQETREQAATKIQNLVIWLWGIYTTATAVGFALSEKQLSFWPVFLIVATSAFLILVYWSTVWVQFPVRVEFDPRSPTEIMEAYESGVRVKNFRLRITLALSILAAAMVSASLIVASFSQKHPESGPWFETKILNVNGNRMLAILGNSGGREPVSIFVVPANGAPQPTDISLFVLLPDEQGSIQTSLPLQITTPVTVTVQWIDNNQTHFELARRLEE